MSETTRVRTGIDGLDAITGGGLPATRAYLVRGSPGAGKTMAGLHFLRAGARLGEPVLYITLTEPEAQLRANAATLGFDLAGVSFLDLSPTADFFAQAQTYDLFSPAEVEREPMTGALTSAVEAVRPRRVFLDAMTQLRYLSSDPFQFRRQALSFLRFLVEQGATVLFTSESGPDVPDDDLQFMSDGVIHLFNDERGRGLQVTKLRGSAFAEGRHAVRLSADGIHVFPRLIPESHRQLFDRDTISSGVPELDELLHGGLERGTITIISGPSGAGKTTVGLQFMKEAAGRGERSVAFIFEESLETLLRRCEGINIPARLMMERGTLAVETIEPLQLTPDEFASMVRDQVEEHRARIVMIDSTAGYRQAMRGEDLVSHLHAICRYLKNMGVTVLLIHEIETISGDFRATEIGISYLADNMLFMRYMEYALEGRVELRKVIGVLKKRTTDFEKTVRELELTRYGIKVGRAMPHVQGILGGILRAEAG